MESSTGLRIVKRFPDGRTGDVAVGTINVFGRIAIDRTAPGQQDGVAQLVAELNALDTVYEKRLALREPETPPVVDGQPEGLTPPQDSGVHSTLVKEAFHRGTPGFFGALIATTERFYGLELQFDAAALTAALEERAAAEEAAQAAEETARAEAEAAEMAALEARVAEIEARAAELEEDEEEDEA